MLSRIMNAPSWKSLFLCLPVASLCTRAGAAEPPNTKLPDYELQPLYTHYAKTLSKVTFRSTISWFNGVELQEANHFNGATIDAELVIPFLKRFEIILAGPIYTWGRADLIQPGHPTIDLYGWSGTFQFPNAQLQWQFLAEENNGMNMAVHAGYGTVIGKLHTTTDDFFQVGASDIYNHGGQQVIGGVRLDRKINDWFTVIGDLGVTYYITSDDLHPDSGGDSWALGTFSGAGVFHPWEARIYPAFELVYSTDFGNYNSVTLVPEVIVPVCSNFEVKIGFAFGVTGDGQDYGASFQGVFRF
jgi:hypothetical protein